MKRRLQRLLVGLICLALSPVVAIVHIVHWAITGKGILFNLLNYLFEESNHPPAKR